MLSEFKHLFFSMFSNRWLNSLCGVELSRWHCWICNWKSLSSNMLVYTKLIVLMHFIYLVKYIKVNLTYPLYWLPVHLLLGFWISLGLYLVILRNQWSNEMRVSRTLALSYLDTVMTFSTHLTSLIRHYLKEYMILVLSFI